MITPQSERSQVRFSSRNANSAIWSAPRARLSTNACVVGRRTASSLSRLGSLQSSTAPRSRNWQSWNRRCDWSTGLNGPPQHRDARQVRTPEAEFPHVDAAARERVVALRACQAFSDGLENSDNGYAITRRSRREICNLERTHAVGLPWFAGARDARCRWRNAVHRIGCDLSANCSTRSKIWLSGTVNEMCLRS